MNNNSIIIDDEINSRPNITDRLLANIRFRVFHLSVSHLSVSHVKVSRLKYNKYILSQFFMKSL
jgi:hypothetical protein